MGEVLAWLEAAQAEAARAQRNLPASETSPTAGGESVALAASGVAGATTSDWITAHSVPDEAGCLIWTGWTNSKGYGTTKIAGRTTTAQRAAWVMVNGPVPDGYTVDHLCRVRNCINPDHLEAVLHRVNCHRSPFTRQSINAAKTECPKGHPYSDENTFPLPRRATRMPHLQAVARAICASAGTESSPAIANGARCTGRRPQSTQGVDMAKNTEPFLSVGVLINDDTQLTPTAQRSRSVADGVIAAVQIGSTGATAVQSNSPAALRRLAAALNDAADKAEAITEAGK